MIKKENLCRVGTFLLVIYYSISAFQKYIYIYPSITVPLSITLAILLVIFSGYMSIKNKYESNILGVWLILIIYIYIHNVDILDQILNHGLLQLTFMILFLVFSQSNYGWMKTAFKWIFVFTMMHAIFTIIFAFNSSLYNIFVHKVIGTDIDELMINYNRGAIAGLTTHYSTNGMYLGIGVGVVGCIVLLSKVIEKYKIIMLISVIMALILTGKRGPLLFFCISSIIVYFIYETKESTSKIFKITFFGIIIVTIVYIACLYIPQLNTVFYRFANMDNDLTNGRTDLFELAFQMFKENPIIGQGWGSYRVRTYTAGFLNTTTSAHNQYLQILSELGIVGLVMYLIIFINSLVYSIRMLNSSRKKINICSEEDEKYLAISIYIQCYTLLYGLSSTALMYYPILIPYIMACAIPFTITYKKRRLR